MLTGSVLLSMLVFLATALVGGDKSAYDPSSRLTTTRHGDGAPGTDLRLSTTTGDGTSVVNTLDEFGRVIGERVFAGGELVSQRLRGYQDDGSVAWTYAPRLGPVAAPALGLGSACPRLPGAVCIESEGGLPSTVTRDGRETGYGYTPDGELSSVDHGGLKRTYTRDLAGRITSSRVTPNAETRFTYDASDRVTRVVHPGGRATTYEYRPDGRLRFRRFERVLGGGAPDDGLASVEHRYDALGRVATIHEDHVAVAEPDVVTTLGYDAFNNLSRISRGAAYESTRTYDAAGKLTRATSRDGVRSATFDWSYGPNSDRPSTFTATSGASILSGSFDRYDGAGRTTHVTLGPVRATHTYRAGRLVGTRFEDVATASLLASFSESGHDLRGHAGRLEQRAGDRSRVDGVTYDEQGRLSRFGSEDEAGESIDGQLTYDGTGHRTRARLANRGDGTPLRDDQLTTEAHGGLSQVTLRVEARDVRVTAEPDGRITALDNLNLSRDRQGRPTRDTYGHDGNRVASADGSRISRHGDTVSTVRSADNYTWLYSPPLPGFGLAFRDDSWSIDLTNAQRSPLATTDETGRLTRTATYDPFGEADEVLTPGEGPPPTSFGGYLRIGTGVGGQTLLDAGQRLYHPRWGRFLEPDPVSPNPADPRTFASFAYGFNDPVAYVDPDGRCAIPGAILGAAAGAIFGAIGSMLNGDPPEVVQMKALVGGLNGLITGATCGLGVGGQLAVGMVTNAASEVANAALDGQRGPKQLAIAALRGGISGGLAGSFAKPLVARGYGPVKTILGNFALDVGADLAGQATAASLGGEEVSLRNAVFAGVFGTATRGVQLGAPDLGRASFKGAKGMVARARGRVDAAAQRLGQDLFGGFDRGLAYAGGGFGGRAAPQRVPRATTAELGSGPALMAMHQGPAQGGGAGRGAGASKGVDDFVLGKHGLHPSPRPTGTQSHHGVMSAWMKKHFPGYSPNEAPAILMPKAAHEMTFGVYNRWRAQMKEAMGGKFDWSKVSEGQMRGLSESMFDAAGVPAQMRGDYWQWFDRMKTALQR